MKARRFGLIILFVGSLLIALALLLSSSLNVYAGEQLNAVHNRYVDYLPVSDDSHLTELRFTVSISFTPAYTTYLPLISKPFIPAGIYGRITYQGEPVTNTEVELRFCRPIGRYVSCYTTGLSSTVQNGYYQFTNAPSLLDYQSYQVTFSGYDSKYLSWWDSFPIYTYTAGQTVPGGDFDVADVTLLAPDDATTATLPLHFQWMPRSVTPSDSYRVGLVNYNTHELLYSEYLGYVNSYTLTTLPSRFAAGVPHTWSVWVTAPDGGWGLSRQGRTFTVDSGRAH